MSKPTRQSRIEGGRLQVGAGLEPRIEAWVRQQMRRFGVSRPMVLSLACSVASGIDIDDSKHFKTPHNVYDRESKRWVKAG